MNPRKLAAKIDAIYARLPRMQCKQLCQECCGPIALSDAEWRRIERGRGALPMFDSPDLTCPLLEQDTGRCSIYEMRPLVCRAWGMTLRLVCPHGCRPDRWLTDREMMLMMKALEDLTGRPTRYLEPEGFAEALIAEVPLCPTLESATRPEGRGNAQGRLEDRFSAAIGQTLRQGGAP